MAQTDGPEGIRPTQRLWHLAGIWALCTAATFVMSNTFFATAFWGGSLAVAILLVLAELLGLYGLLAMLGRANRELVPLPRGRRGHHQWAAAVTLLGTAGAIAVQAAALRRIGLIFVLFPLTALPYALTAALFLPGRAPRSTSVALSAALALALGVLPRFADEEPPAPAPAPKPHPLALVGRPPHGYQPTPGLTNDTVFTTHYRSATAPDITLRVNRVPADRTRPYESICAHRPQTTATCTDDGAGRTLVTDRKAGTHELYLRRADLDVVASFRTTTDPAAARSILTTLRPLTDDEARTLLPG
ncbi:hypothetical protein [Streptomyces sp. NPDC003077]|uniref:hypothetical protein n=1 Tax=Streptomyces sp. NPDC003077 TaxID=3154443 RepID=UPI0033B07C9F